ncbi:MAG: methyltransferase domain-containing protein [Planctomycetota bacterium]
MPDATPREGDNLLPSSGEERASLHAWRRLYEKTASASDWHELHRWHAEDAPIQAAEDIRGKLEVQPGDVVLEVGCGCGAMMANVLTDGQRGIGFDHCEALVRRHGDFDVCCGGLSLGVADASSIPILSRSVDRVFSYSVFQCFPTKDYARRVIAECLRVCKPGGVILIGDIFGTMEKQVQGLQRMGLSRRAAETTVVPLAPFWFLQRRIRGGRDGLHRRTYSRAFFRRVFRRWGLEAEFLLQEMSQRPYATTRYDVRVRIPK